MINEDQFALVTDTALTFIKLQGSKSDQMPLPKNIYICLASVPICHKGRSQPLSMYTIKVWRRCAIKLLIPFLS